MKKVILALLIEWKNKSSIHTPFVYSSFYTADKLANTSTAKAFLLYLPPSLLLRSRQLSPSAKHLANQKFSLLEDHSSSEKIFIISNPWMVCSSGHTLPHKQHGIRKVEVKAGEKKKKTLVLKVFILMCLLIHISPCIWFIHPNSSYRIAASKHFKRFHTPCY